MPLNTKLFVSVTTVSMLAGAGSVLAASIQVPAEYATVQEAINAAAPGDEVVLAPGVYTDSFSFKEDHVLVRSADGPATTIVDGSAHMDYASVLFPSYSSGEVRGLTIRNHEHSFTGAVTIKKATALVVDCVFEDNRNYFTGAALRIDSWTVGDAVDVEVRGCTFRNNTSSDWGGAMSVVLNEGENLLIVDCLFEDNTSESGGHLLLALNGPGGHIQVEQCTFRRGEGDQVAGVHVVNEGIGSEGFNDVSMLECTFEDHVQDSIFVEGEVMLTVDNSSFQNSGSPVINLFAPSTAEIVNSQFCGISVPIIGEWTDLGDNSFDPVCICIGDGNGDGQVSVQDLLGLIAAFGEPHDIWDWDEDGIVGVNDLLLLIERWGAC